MLTQTESDIMRDIYHFLRAHADPPPPRTRGSDAFWEQAAGEVVELGKKWKNHPLLACVLPGIYEYIEQKQLNGGDKHV